MDDISSEGMGKITKILSPNATFLTIPLIFIDDRGTET